MIRVQHIGDMLRFRCPGCGQEHHLNLLPGQRPRWNWNGDAAHPTISPSINATVADRAGNVRRRCHSFVKAGQIRFLPDCTHPLKGQTVDLPEIAV